MHVTNFALNKETDMNKGNSKRRWQMKDIQLQGRPSYLLSSSSARQEILYKVLQDIHVETTKLQNYDKTMEPIKFKAITQRMLTEATEGKY